MSDTTRHKENNIVIDDVQGGEKKVMTKFNKRIINVLATATLVAGVAAPVTAIVAPTAIHAQGSGTPVAMSTPAVVANDKSQRVGSVKFEVAKNATLHNGDQVVIDLPFDLKPNDDKDKYSSTDAAYGIIGRDFSAFVGIPSPKTENTLDLINEDDLKDSVKRANFKISPSSSADRIIVEYVGEDTTVLGDPAVFMLTLGGLVIDKSKEATVTFQAPGSSPFPGGSVTVATVASNKNSLNVSFGSLDTSNERFDPKIVIEEPYAGALTAGDQYGNGATEVKVKLPNGYVWTTEQPRKVVYGNFDPAWLKVEPSSDKQELTITVQKGKDTRAEDKKTISKIEIPYDFRVDDSSKVKKGDIIARLTGRTHTNISEGKIGTYGEYESTLTAEAAPTLVSGQDEQRIADFHITEAVGDSIVTGTNGRYLELTLPEGARWQEEYEWDLENQKVKTDKPGKGTLPTVQDEGLTVEFEGFTGNNNRTAKFFVKPRPENNTDAATLDFEDLEVALAPDFTGDLKISVGGSAGVKGDVTVAKVVAPVTAQAASTPDVIIGAREQKAGDLTITEGKAGALVDDGEVRLVLPDGVKFANTPTVKVSGGDLVINNVRRSSNDTTVIFDVEGESDTASTISVSGINVILDRTVPEGKVELSVEGDAVSETQKYSNWKDNTAVAKTTIAKVSTPAPVEDSKGNTVSIFKIGSTSYTVNGATYTADVAPYIENGRTFLPVRYVADALGVAPQNIKFDKKTSTVTLLKGDRIVQIKLKTNILTVNGAVINMDVKAITKNNRTVLPISWVGQALGADIKWDKDTNTVTVTQVK
ncbi:copper amine oxidase N-terminal domain-containing protein [Paenibacillus macerans]|uniref:copper amine oxidase N-terminal domain-containing protein n=1 Tax=Paenibacillus macerans TaxID=44252 RepID=UPI0022E7B8BB|nr:copper amine oxidase N-terminal domain-containing protein [Paenibacillus macerans]MBS5911288.1 copper amine oxidase N-terminal domain-containing protein [Paenibacillus macerans]MED4955597.1 copper amine oxidase N-terminal domain-containing protein [Paenibacillus macerans]